MIGPQHRDRPHPAIRWERWRTPEVRDLAWLLASDDIVAAAALLPAAPLALDRPAAADLLRVLRRLDATPVDRWLPEDRSGRRLGRYAERLIAAWLQHSARLRLLAQGVALVRDGRTIGECDFLVETASGDREHWELSVKLYLRTAPDSAAWLGADPADGLAGKLAALSERQVRIHLTPEFRDRFGSGWRARAMLRGWLFEPVTADLVGTLAAAAAAARTAAAGVRALPFRTPHGWLHGEPAQLARIDAALPGLRWWPLPRRRWLRPCVRDLPPSAAPGSLEQTVSAGGGSTVLAAALVAVPEGWAEVGRVMIVRPGWPLRPTPAAPR